MTKAHLKIFDTTLRDGEQSPGVTLTVDEKVEIAKQLSKLGVDICEAGFPIASQGDFKAVERIAKEVGPLMVGRAGKEPMIICGLARAVPGDIQRAYDAIKHAPKHRIHTFLATSDIHLQYKLKITREQCIQKSVDAVKFARSLGCQDVEFSCEDAARSDKDFIVTVLKAVVEAGATTLNIPDTVGYHSPGEYGNLIKYLIDRVSNPSITFSTHCHNDLGLATANTLSGVLNGARQVEVTINGIGERAGNTALEEIVMAINTQKDYYPVFHKIDTLVSFVNKQIYNTSQLVTKKTGMVVQPNKAIVGANAFAHESGIHQDGMLKNKLTYEIMSPESIGMPSKALVLGKHSGRNAFKAHLEAITKSTIYEDYIKKSDLFDEIFSSFKKLADVKKAGVSDADLFAILDDVLNLETSGSKMYSFVGLTIMAGTGILATATVSIKVAESEDTITDAATGAGPVHAIFNAINRIVGVSNVLVSYDVKAVSEGSDSPGEVTVRIKQETERQTKKMKIDGEQIYQDSMISGRGMDEDILIASAKAYLNAVNRMLGVSDRRYQKAVSSV